MWSQGFGFESKKTKKQADAHTVYRVGSVSKLFTDMAIMQRVESGEIDLDEAIQPIYRILHQRTLMASPLPSAS